MNGCTRLIKLYTPYLPTKLTILLLSPEQMEKSFAAQAVEIVHTREVLHWTAAACARHNYIMRCTLAYPENLRRTRPRECTRTHGNQ